ncbi:hypothetical protein A6A08_22415 [Nocardiopsis sp. TSRI0078]|nr:hypothetical protein A6A08_22415 [Nocardiopsis sp. TSRI0078]
MMSKVFASGLDVDTPFLNHSDCADYCPERRHDQGTRPSDHVQSVDAQEDQDDIRRKENCPHDERPLAWWLGFHAVGAFRSVVVGVG